MQISLSASAMPLKRSRAAGAETQRPVLLRITV